MAESREPYVGPRPFDRQDEALFFGRERESSDLISLVIAHPATLLYSQSGAGKTSLLQARLVPLLEARGSQVLGIARVGGEVPEGFDPAGIRNIYILNTWMTLRDHEANAEEACQSSLGELLATIPQKLDGGRPPARRILIFDQFEEIFTSAPARWQDREGFFEELGGLLEEDSRLRVVFAMREEHIAGLDPYLPLLPERLRTRFRLEQLRETSALEAVQGPLRGTTRTFAPGAAEKLVHNLLLVPVKDSGRISRVPGEFVEPVHLQVVCRKLWRSLPAGVTEIAEKYVKYFADVDEALSAYYEDCIQAVCQETGLREGALRRWFGKKLITPEGTRGLVYMGLEATGDLPNGAVEKLENLHLLRAEIRGGTRWYELAHDRLIEPIQRSNRKWNQERDRLGLTLEAQAERWEQSGKSSEWLLSKVEVLMAVELLRSPAAEDLGSKRLIRELVKASRDRSDRIRMVLFAVGLFGALVATGGVAYFFWQASQRAEDAKYSERGNVARFMAEHGEKFAAVGFGIRAVEPRLAKDRVPKEALDGLRFALGKLGDYVWLHQHEPIVGIELSTSGRFAVTQTAKTLTSWDVRTGAPKNHLISSEPETVVQFGISPDEKLIWGIQREQDPTKRRGTAWYMESGKSAAKLAPQLQGASFIVFSRDGNRLLAFRPIGADRGEVDIVEVSSRKRIMRLPFTHLRALDITTDGRLLASVEEEKHRRIFRVLSIPEGKLVIGPLARSVSGRVTGSYRIQFSHDGRKLLIAWMNFGPDRFFDLAVWDTTEKRVIELKALEGFDIRYAEFLEGGARAFAMTRDPTGMFVGLLYDGETGTEIGRRSYRPPAGAGVESSGHYLVLASKTEGTETRTIWDALTGAVTTVTFPGSISEFTLVPEARRFVAVEKEGEAAIIGEMGGGHRDLKDLRPTELLERACATLLYMPEYEQVKNECSGRVKKDLFAPATPRGPA